MKLRHSLILSSLCAISLAPSTRAGTLAEAPLSVTASVPSNVIFPLSVEFPTAVTAAYMGTSDYTSAKEYLGIFNPDKCYSYDTTNNWFAPSAMASNRTCTNAWSGNFLNWATMTGLDEFRVAMTGGNRYVDTTTKTVLERTYMSGQGSTASNFPDRVPPWTTSISGAVPTAYASLTRIANLNKGVKMTVTNGGTNTDFYVRAVVCDPAIGTVGDLVKENCTAYGTSPIIYKPTGKIQKYGERMRFGVFSYFNSNSIDNAVMRSKAKYVAPMKWTASGSTSNANKEWDEATGVLATNPDPTEASASRGGAVSNSGVINYINKFGSSAHAYKTYDNFGKLWFEALRYLQGLTPTLDFYTKATLANGDGFPIITAWDDPVQYSCQKNFLMGMGDTHTWCDKRLPGGKFSSYVNNQCNAITGTDGQLADQGSLASDSGVDISQWTDLIDAKEPAVSNMSTSSIQNGASYNMAGLSYWAAYLGIRPKNNLALHTPSATPANNIKVQSFIIDVLENKDLGINKQFWFATKYGGADSFDATGTPLNWATTRTFSSPYPTFNGAWPKTLLPAGDPASMKAAVDSALASIAASSMTTVSSTPSSGNLATQSGSGVNAYSTSFDPSDWSGDVVSKIIDVTDLSVSTTPAWKASAKLPAWGSRKILTFNDGLNVDGTETNASAPAPRTGVSFSWADLSPRQQAFLNRDPADGDTTDTKGSDRLNYIRGDGSNEGNNGHQWRSRSSRLGDFVNSAPVLVKAASNRKETDYATYKSAAALRTPMLYVGGNDGMLHAFNAEANADGTAKADSGKEIFAFVPSAVFPKLNKLPWNEYGHLYYVDATPVVADAKIDTGCSAASDATKCWRTVLVGGLGAGGQGIYALNVTDSNHLGSMSASDIVMWEFTDRDDADLGFTFSRPFVRKMNNGKWAVIFGNGYNSKEDDNDVGGVERKGSGRAFLYVVFLDGPTGTTNRAWVQNTDYIKIELKDPDESTTAPEQNGLSSVNGVDSNNDGTIDYLYAGDRRGNLWKINVSAATSASWAAAYGTAAAPTPLFTAKTADTTPVLQQVTTTPLISRHPKGGYLVLFGTGSYVEQSDVVSPFSTNSFYGIWDKNDGTMSSIVPIARSKLQKQKMLAIAGDYTLLSNCKPQYESTPQNPVSATTSCPSSLQPATSGGKVDQQFGWALDLNYQMSTTPTGERYISNSLPTLESDVLTFKTLTTSGDPCDGSGKDHLYNVDYRTGGAYASPVFIDLSGTTVTTLYVNFGGSVGSLPPSGKVLTTGTGQNPVFVKYTANKGEGTPGTDTIGGKVTFGGCSNFVPGRPCLKDVFNYDPDSQTRVRAAPWGTVGWRQLP